MSHIKVTQIPALPRNMPSEQVFRAIEELFIKHAIAINTVKHGVTGDVSLATAPATTTDISESSITADTYVQLCPTNLMAAAEIGAGNVYITYPSPGVARINHTASAQARTFRYLLLALLLCIGVRAEAQQIQDDGVPLEVRPALDFTGNIVCVNDANSTNCSATAGGAGVNFSAIGASVADVVGDVMTVTDSGSINFTMADNPEDLTAVVTCAAPITCAAGQPVDVTAIADADLANSADHMLASAWATIYGYPYVDLAAFADYAGGVDSNNNLLPEIWCNPGINCGFDIDQDGGFDFAVSLGSVEYDGGALRAADGLGVGNLTSAAAGVSTCFGRSATASVDRLFEDKDCDYPTQNEPETTPLGTTNSEAFLTDMQRHLAADFATNGTTDATGVQVTGLKLDLDWLGLYRIEYQILSQSSDANAGLAYGVEYTGTETTLFCIRRYGSSGTTAATGFIDDVAATKTGQLTEQMSANAASTTVPNLGPNEGVITINSTALETIECNLLTTTAGDLTFWVASETNGSIVRVMENSTVRATPFP